MVTKRLPLDELISREAHRLALLHFIKTNNISPDDSLPSDTQTQITAILNSFPEFYTTAKTNVLTEKSAHEEILRNIGVDSYEIDAIEELDL